MSLKNTDNIHASSVLQKFIVYKNISTTLQDPEGFDINNLIMKV